MKTTISVAIAAALLAAVTALPSSNGLAAGKSNALFAPEKGSFKILVSGQQIGKEEFEIGPNAGGWVAKGN